MLLLNWGVSGWKEAWRFFSWPVNVGGGNISAMVSLSHIHVFNTDDWSAVGYIVGYKTQANPNIIAYTSGEPSVIFVNGCSQLIFGLTLYGNVHVRVSGVIWP